MIGILRSFFLESIHDHLAPYSLVGSNCGFCHRLHMHGARIDSGPSDFSHRVICRCPDKRGVVVRLSTFYRRHAVSGEPTAPSMRSFGLRSTCRVGDEPALLRRMGLLSGRGRCPTRSCFSSRLRNRCHPTDCGSPVFYHAYSTGWGGILFDLWPRIPPRSSGNPSDIRSYRWIRHPCHSTELISQHQLLLHPLCSSRGPFRPRLSALVFLRGGLCHILSSVWTTASAVPLEENIAFKRPLLYPPNNGSIYHFVFAVWISGCDTSRCQITA